MCFKDKSKTIRRGYFGTEYGGQANNLPVTVKCSSFSKLQSKILLSELKALIYLKKHENIIDLVGANTVNLKQGTVYLFVEQCPLDNLQAYLKTTSDHFISLIEADKFSNNIVIPKDKNYEISTANLLLWSHQISSALEHFSKTKVLHGDLSARNVLVFKKDLVKVSNIGVSQKCRELLPKLSNNKEPLSWRWMAIESLMNREYSTQTDVWSFGVTLWEMFSLGETPYPNLRWMPQFPAMLKHNMRMQKPQYATTLLYNLMMECWKENPSERPKPETITTYLGKLRRESMFENYHLLMSTAEADTEESTV